MISPTGPISAWAISASARPSRWDYQLSQCERYRYYFDGDIFTETVPQERGNEEDEPVLMYPVGLNLVKMLSVAQADATFGEWETNPVRFGTRPDSEVSEADIAAIDLVHKILEHSNAQSQLWEHELDRQVFGGGALKITPALKYPHIRWSRIPREAFFPIWDPDDPDDLLEVFVVIAMSPEQAKARYGYEAHNDLVRRVEHWTKRTYENYLDGHKITEFSGYNPWGIVPFVYTPRYRFSNWWGEPLSPDIMDVQDELNMRIADIGEAINYNAHPVRWGINLPRDFNAKNYPLGPNAMWNLGRALQGQPVPEVGMLEAKNAVSPGVLEHVRFLYDWSRTSVFAPPIAFGEDNGGGQRSGTTLEVRMMPLIKSVRRSRSYLTAGMRRALQITAILLEQKKFGDVPVRAVQSMHEGQHRAAVRLPAAARPGRRRGRSGETPIHGAAIDQPRNRPGDPGPRFGRGRPHP